MRELEVFEQAVEFAAVQSAPGTVEVISGLRLLPCVVVVQELKNNRSVFFFVKMQFVGKD